MVSSPRKSGRDAARAPAVAVVGPGDATEELASLAEQVGELVAAAGAIVVTGGLGGVMAAAARGAARRGGLTVGLLPGRDRHAANEWVQVAVATGLGEGRNAVVVASADAVIAVGGSWGTLAEVALACRAGLPVAALGGWQVTTADGSPVAGGPIAVATPSAAVRAALGPRDADHS